MSFKLQPTVSVPNLAFPRMRLFETIPPKLVWKWVSSCSKLEIVRCLTVEQGLLDLFPVGHDEWPMLEDSLI